MLVTHNIFKSCKNAYTSLQIVLFNFSCKSNYGKKKKRIVFLQRHGESLFWFYLQIW